MADFSTIVQSPQIRAIVQENMLYRAFHDALFPRLLFRTEAADILYPSNVGDTMAFTGVGLIPPKMKPLVPGTEPIPSTYQLEQWTATLQQYADTQDTPMPTSIVAIANLFLRNAQQLGLGAGRSLNRLVRNRMYNAGIAGWTVADGAQSSVTSLKVKRLNGFTRARAAGSPVQFATVSGSNPLPIIVNTSTAVNVIGYTPTNAGDEFGPGTLLLDAAVTVVDRAAVRSVDQTALVRIGGGNTIDSITNANIMTLAALRSAVSRLWQENVPEMPDGRFHAHLDPIMQSQIFADPEWQRVQTSLPDYFQFRAQAVGEAMGAVLFRNSECPLPETVDGAGSVFPTLYNLDDNFAGELVNATLVPIHRALVVGQGGIFEYYQDLSQLITEAGITGKVGEPRITNNGIEVSAERVQLILRAPLGRLQDTVSTSWKFIGDWPIRTDSLTGDAARFKRFVVIEGGA